MWPRSDEKNRLPAQHPPGHGEQRVADGEAERDDGNEQRHRGGGLLVGLERGRREHEAHEEAAAVPHEDRRRVEVVAEEPQQAAGQADHEEGHEGAVVREAHPEDGGRGGQRDAGGEAVEAVDEVEGVRDAHNPEDGEGEAEEPQVEGSERGGDGVGPVAGPPHPRRDQDLDGELDARAGAVQVVVDAQGGHGEAAQDEGEGTLRLAPEEPAHTGVEEEEGDERGVEGDHDGHAAETGDGPAVDLPGGEGVVEHAGADGCPADQGGEHERDGEGDEKGDDDRLQAAVTSPRSGRAVCHGVGGRPVPICVHHFG